MNILAKPEYTPEDLLALPDRDKVYELVDGQLVEKPMGFRSSRIAGRLCQTLANYCDVKRLGWVLPQETSYQCFPSAPNRVRKPDGSFIRRERLPLDQEPEGHCRLAPDLAIEVSSPNDEFDDLEERVSEYLTVGVRLVWVVSPVGQRVFVHRAAGPGAILRADDELSGEDVLPGFRCPVRDLFLPPPGVGPDSPTS